jgi:uncharacterized protein
MRALLDVNVLVALLQPDHVHFERAHRWWAEQSGGWASCPLTQNGFIRIVSQPSYPRPLPVARAIEELAARIAETDHQFWPDDVSLLDPETVDRSRLLGPKQLTDVYLLALAVKNGGGLTTFDRAIPIRAVRRAEAENLVVL